MKKAVFAAAIILSLLSVVFLCGNKDQPGVPAPKIMVIGIDAAGWDLMELPLNEGRLPHLSRLIDTGTTGSLRSIAPAHPPALWTSIATGKTPSQHKIEQFTILKNGHRRPVSGADREASAFWNILSRNGFRTGVLNWWNSWPAEKVNGFMVTDRFRDPQSKEPLTFPQHLAGELPHVSMNEEQFAAEMKNFGLSDSIRSTSGSRPRDEFASQYKNHWTQDKNVVEISHYLLLNDPVDVFAVVFRIAHFSSHLFWSNMEQEIPQLIRARLRRGRTVSEADREKIRMDLARKMSPVFIYLDQVIGSLLEYADENTTVIVCSGHGFHLEEGARWHAELRSTADGILILHGPQIRQDHRLEEASILDITPTLLYLADLPSAQDMGGTTLVDAIAPEYLKLHPLNLVASHDIDRPNTAEPVSNEMNQELLEEWKALRYIR